MNFICLLSRSLYAIFILFQLINSLTIKSSLRREIRFSWFDIVSLNKSIASVERATFKQFNDKQKLFIYVIFHKSIPEIEATFTVSKCKAHFVDCVNVVSYEIRDVCSKIHLVTDLSDLQTLNNRPVTCPLFGHYEFNNVTFDGNKFGTMFSFQTEKWWENYWKFKVMISTKDRRQVIYGCATVMISASLRSQHSFMIQYHHNTIKYVTTKIPQ